MGFNSMINRIPHSLTGRVGSSTGNYQLSNNIYQWAIGGYPLLSAATDQRPDVEAPVEQRKNQFDSFKDPGEYSLNQWWLRSQSEFNGGAGVVYQDPDTQSTYLVAKNTRFNTSLGLDPFTDYSQISLLGEMNASTVMPASLDSGFAYNSYIQSFVDPAGSDSLFIARGHTVYRASVGAADISIVSTLAIPTEAGQNFGITGGIAYVGGGMAGGNMVFVYQDQSVFTTNDGVWQVTAGGGITNIYAGDGTHKQKTIGFLKGQLLLASGNSIYQLNTTGARTALPTPVAVAPEGQVITSMTAGPDAVYVAANDGANGYIYKTTYSTSTITLINGLQQIAVMPNGEQINDIAFYVGTYLIIATDQGARVAQASNSGISYGPLIFSFPKIVGQTNGCKGISFFGTIAYIGTYSSQPQHDGAWGLFAVDLGTVNADSVTGFTTNAYARSLYSPVTTTPIFDVTVGQSGRLYYTSLIPNSGVQGMLWIEHTNRLTPTGYLITGRCRFNTLEPKLFKFFSVRTPPLRGALTVSVLDTGGGETTYITFGTEVNPNTSDIPTPIPVGQADWIELKFVFNRGVIDPTVGAAMNGWQIKALPGTTKQRTIEKWFLCFNNQQDNSGNRVGGDTYALDTLNFIRTICQRGDTVNLQDLVNNVSTLVVVDSYQFVMMAPPGPGSENYGGYLKVDMRSVADVLPPVLPTTGGGVD